MASTGLTLERVEFSGFSKKSKIGVRVLICCDTLTQKLPPPHTHATLAGSKFPEITQDEFGGRVLEPVKQVNRCFLCLANTPRCPTICRCLFKFISTNNSVGIFFQKVTELPSIDFSSIFDGKLPQDVEKVRI
jgi:hypothetical protein